MVLNSHEIEDIKIYYLEGHTQQECADKFNFERHTIGRHLKREGVIRTRKKSCFFMHAKRKHGTRWNGGRCSGKYVLVYTGNRQGDNIYRREHVLMVEKVLGRKIKRGEIIHHVNGDTHDNRNCNFILCDQSYHIWLHHRMSKLYQQEHFSQI